MLEDGYCDFKNEIPLPKVHVKYTVKVYK